MNQEQLDHQTAVDWINGEIDQLIKCVGQPNASSAARSALTLAFLLRVINTQEHRTFMERIDKIYERHNGQVKEVA